MWLTLEQIIITPFPTVVWNNETGEGFWERPATIGPIGEAITQAATGLSLSTLKEIQLEN